MHCKWQMQLKWRALANWTFSKDVIIPAPVTMSDAQQRAGGKDYQVKDWYFAMKNYLMRN